ncbi:MAG: hypothetical protein H0U13_10585 [Gemmatimonadaceae bacterium]|nr:hypothetical protein [Gemmatimonadaceae bacterium]
MTILLRGALRKSGDSLELLASVVDATTTEERRIATRRFSTEGIRDAESGLAADVAGAVFRVAIPAMTDRLTRPIHPESYRLMLEGYHILLSGPPHSPIGGTRKEIVAGERFTRAVSVDPSNAGAWSGLSSVWASQAVRGAIPFDEGFERASAAALRALALDPLQGAAWANLAAVRAMKYRNLEVGLKLIGKAEAAEPSDPEVYLIKATMLRSAHLYDRARDASRIARRLDPLSSQSVHSEAYTDFCAGRPEAALALYESELSLNPSDRIAGQGRIRALALLGRYDEAIAGWRQYAAAEGDTALTRRLAGAKGKGDYWRVKHAKGRKRLASQERRSGHMSPFHIMMASFEAGDADAGFSMLDKAAEVNLPALYRLSCVGELDEFRNTPQFAAAVARIGSLPSR